MNAFLNRIYLAAALVAAAAIAAICLLISAQVLLNAGTRMGLPLPVTIPSYTDFAGFLLATATYLALPWTLRSGGHVRVTLVTSSLPPRAKLGVEVFVLGLAALFAGYATRYAVSLLIESHEFGDVSPGIVPVPLWIPQIGMVLGLGLLTVALVHSLIQTWTTGRTVGGGGEEA